MKPNAVVVLNPAARGGAGRRRFALVEHAIAERFAPRVVETDLAGDWRSALERELRDGTRVYLAAGGDGTVSAVVDALWRANNVPLDELTLGAIGLGSSNDFHRPVKTAIAKIPLRVDSTSANLRDVALAEYVTEAGDKVTRAFITSASLGAATYGNAQYTNARGLLRVLKKMSAGAAMNYAILKTLVRNPTVKLTLRVTGETFETEISMLSVMKTHYLGAGLRYDRPVDPANGQFAVNLAQAQSRLGFIKLLTGLSKGRFLGPPGRKHWMSERVEVELAQPSDLELDGEVVRATRVNFSVLPQRIHLCA